MMWFLSRGLPLPLGAWGRLRHFIVTLPVPSVYLSTEIYVVLQGYLSVCESYFIWVGGFHKRSMSSANNDLDFAPGEYSNQHEYLPSLIRVFIVRCRKTIISQVADQTGRKLGSNPSLR